MTRLLTHRRATWRSALKATVVLAGMLAMLWGYAVLGRQAEFEGTPLVARQAPPLALLDDDGRAFTLASLRGRAVLVYFGYTHCPDVCPTTLAALHPVFDQLGAEAARVQVLFVSLDPRRDTPALLRGYLAAFAPTPLGLTGTQQQVADAARAWGIHWRYTGNGRFIDHTSVVTLVDPEGRVRVRYGYAQLADPRAMAHDVLRILHESDGRES
ncbi:SCO family protein [Paraburkholderia acidipaludis]|uniref:SCO family protein n=1 Tax=Paraburkholderia acidipaludis TaxID=660537 RepID=UPI0005B7E827|nr:SCO family protein [Paraburkholderia acidipaludis]